MRGGEKRNGDRVRIEGERRTSNGERRTENEAEGAVRAEGRYTRTSTYDIRVYRRSRRRAKKRRNTRTPKKAAAFRGRVVGLGRVCGLSSRWVRGWSDEERERARNRVHRKCRERRSARRRETTRPRRSFDLGRAFGAQLGESAVSIRRSNWRKIATRCMRAREMLIDPSTKNLVFQKMKKTIHIERYGMDQVEI